MRRRPELVLAATLVLGLLVLLGVGFANVREEAFTLGVQPGGVAAVLMPGDRACQELIDVPEEFSEVELQLGTYRRAGAALELTVHERRGGGSVLGRGSLEGGYPDVSRQRISVGEVAADQQVAVCVEATAGPKVALYGNAGRAAPASTLRVNGKEVDADLTLVFHEADGRSLIAELPDMFDRAALFKGGWVGPWTFWLLTLAVLGLVPLALTRALRGLADGGSAQT
jgi:hypothetical protein